MNNKEKINLQILERTINIKINNLINNVLNKIRSDNIIICKLRDKRLFMDNDDFYDLLYDNNFVKC